MRNASIEQQLAAAERSFGSLSPRAARRGPTTMTSPCAVAGKVAILGPGGAKGVANI